MAIGVIFIASEETVEHYHEINDRINPGNKKLPGMISHSAGMSDQGLCVVEVWESMEALDKYTREVRLKALQDENVKVTPIIYELFNLVQ